MDKKRLLFVVNELSSFLSHRLSLGKAAQQAGYQVHIAAPASDKIQQLTRQGFYFHPLVLNRRGCNPLEELRVIYQLYRLYRLVKPGIVHHLTVKPILYGGIAARLAGVPAVVSAVTGLGYLFIAQSARVKILRYFIKQCFRLSFGHSNIRVIFQNIDDQQKFVQERLLNPKVARLIKGTGVSLEEYQLLSEPPGEIPIVLLPARLLYDKGISEFVAAAEILHDKVKVRMVLAGRMDFDNPAAIPRDQIDSWVEQDIIEYWGFQDDIKAAFSRCHIVCLPSYREGTPRVLIEAAACGRSIVTTDVPGCRDVVIAGENGLLVGSRNVEDLAKAIEKLISDKVLRQRMACRGRQIIAAGFSNHLINKKTLAVYESLYS